MSWVEVESKIKIKGNYKDVRKRIEKISKFVGKEKKIDDYYTLDFNGYPKKSLRVRHKGKKRIVNFKQRVSYVKGVHAKNEVEFEVSDLSGFYDLLKEFGFKKWIRKEKTTYLFKINKNEHIELNYVKNLGWYVEIEILCSKKDIVKARKNIVDIREKLELPEKDVQKKGYTKELWELKKVGLIKKI